MPNIKNPYALARRECSNHYGGGCAGFPIPVPRLGKLATVGTEGEPCLLREADARCGYFEQCVLADPRHSDVAAHYHTDRGKQHTAAAAPSRSRSNNDPNAASSLERPPESLVKTL